MNFINLFIFSACCVSGFGLWAADSSRLSSDDEFDSLSDASTPIERDDSGEISHDTSVSIGDTLITAESVVCIDTVKKRCMLYSPCIIDGRFMAFMVQDIPLEVSADGYVCYFSNGVLRWNEKKYLSGASFLGLELLLYGSTGALFKLLPYKRGTHLFMTAVNEIYLQDFENGVFDHSFYAWSPISVKYTAGSEHAQCKFWVFGSDAIMCIDCGRDKRDRVDLFVDSSAGEKS